MNFPFIRGQTIKISNCRHFCTDGGSDGAMFHDTEDFRAEMNRKDDEKAAAGGVGDILTNELGNLMDLVFPRRCIVCGEILARDERHICFECFEQLPLTYFWQWQDNPAYERICSRADVQAAFSLFSFRAGSPYRRINYYVKYGNGRKTGYRLGYLFGRLIDGSGEGSGLAGAPCGGTVVVPVPLHRMRRWRRGYNQAEVIARGIADALSLELVPNLLKRTRRTRTQTRLSVEEKTGNVKGAFKVNRATSQKMLDCGVGHILLVDDVLTTGATLGECARMLQSDFKVSVASLAFVT